MIRKMMVHIAFFFASTAVFAANPDSQEMVNALTTINTGPISATFSTDNATLNSTALNDPGLDNNTLGNAFLANAPFSNNLLGPSINWASLCSSSESLTDNMGCTPDCNNGSAVAACSAIFQLGQVQQLSGIPLPYLSDGVVVFKLTQLGIKNSAVFNVTLNQIPTDYGYMCEILNANGTPAILWDVQSKPPFPTSIITMDSNIPFGTPIKSDNFVTTVTQKAGGTNYWYNNLKNPLYMLCLGYQVDKDTDSLLSSAACGGKSGLTCVSYQLE